VQQGQVPGCRTKEELNEIEQRVKNSGKKLDRTRFELLLVQCGIQRRRAQIVFIQTYQDELERNASMVDERGEPVSPYMDFERFKRAIMMVSKKCFPRMGGSVALDWTVLNIILMRSPLYKQWRELENIAGEKNDDLAPGADQGRNNNPQDATSSHARELADQITQQAGMHTAAMSIQSKYRIHLRRTRAALKLQSWFRSRVIRNWWRLYNIRKRKAPSHWRHAAKEIHKGREAAVLIQSLMRGHFKRKQVELAKMQKKMDDAVKRIEEEFQKKDEEEEETNEDKEESRVDRLASVLLYDDEDDGQDNIFKLIKKASRRNEDASGDLEHPGKDEEQFDEPDISLLERVERIKKAHEQREEWEHVSWILADALLETVDEDALEKKETNALKRKSRRFTNLVQAKSGKGKKATTHVNWKHIDNKLAVIEVLIQFFFFTSLALQNSILSDLDCPEFAEVFGDSNNGTSVNGTNSTAPESLSIGCLLSLGLNIDSDFIMQEIIAWMPNLNFISLDWLTYDIAFWGSFTIAILYPAFAIPALKHARHGTLGIDLKTGKQAKFPSSEFLLVLVIDLIDNFLYFGIFLNLLAAFSCDYSDLSKITLVRDPNVQCFSLSSPKHLIFVAAAILAIAVFFFLITLISPNLQFNNKMLDLKYSPSFKILDRQAYLLNSGISVFYPGGYLAVTAQVVAVIALLILNEISQPCIVLSFNKWKSAALQMTLWSSLWAFIYLVTRDDNILVLFLPIGWLIPMWVVLRKHRKEKRAAASKVKVDAGEADGSSGENSSSTSQEKAGEIEMKASTPAVVFADIVPGE